MLKVFSIFFLKILVVSIKKGADASHLPFRKHNWTLTVAPVPVTAGMGRVGARLFIPWSGCKEGATLHEHHRIWVGWLRLTKLKKLWLSTRRRSGVWWVRKTERGKMSREQKTWHEERSQHAC